MRLLLSPHVAADLEEIADYIARDSPNHAARFIRFEHVSMRLLVILSFTGCAPRLEPMPVSQPWAAM
jgi:hypothetical protein